MNPSTYSIIEIRIIQDLWEHKSTRFIASMLGRSELDVRRQIQSMDTKGIKLFQPKTVDVHIRPRKVLNDDAWATRLPSKPMFKPVDTSQLKSVRIDSKTTVFVKPGSDIEAVKAKYTNHLKSIF